MRSVCELLQGAVALVVVVVVVVVVVTERVFSAGGLAAIDA